MSKPKDKIVIRCKKCNNRIFDYVAGDMCIEIKCSKCKKLIGVLSFTESHIRGKAVNGEYRV